MRTEASGSVNISSSSGPRTTRPPNSAVVKRSRSTVVEMMSPAAHPSVGPHTVTSRSSSPPPGVANTW